MFRVEGVAVSVAGNLLVRDVSFSVDRGEAFYILGPNGVGKSSLLKAIMGVPGYEVVSGRVKLEEEDISRLPPVERAKRGLALAFQTPPKLHLTVETLLLNICKKTKCDPREVSKALEVEHLLKREVCKLSGGESKRVELATVLAQRPKVALIDEPDSGVDVESLAVVGRALKALNAEAGLVVVTHSAHIARYLPPTAVCVLYGGTFKKCGSRDLVEEVLTYGFGRLD